MRAPTPPAPFALQPNPLAVPGAAAILAPLAPGEAEIIATSLAVMEPWCVYPMSAADLWQLATRMDDGARPFALRLNGKLAGFLLVRPTFLRGPYVQILAVLPGHQGRGLGSAMLAFAESEARRIGARNLWIAAADFNARARDLYARHGFVEAAALPDLICDGITEHLMRKRLV